MTEPTSLEIAPAILAGLISTLIILAAVIAMLAVMPTRFPLNPLYLAGSAFSIDTTVAYLSGISVTVVVGIGYGIFVSAALTGFQAQNLEFAWGGVAGAVLSIVTGTTFAYSRSLNRAVRTGLVGDPGPFLLRYGRDSAIQLVFSHILFGVTTATLYVVLT